LLLGGFYLVKGVVMDVFRKREAKGLEYQGVFRIRHSAASPVGRPGFLCFARILLGLALLLALFVFGLEAPAAACPVGNIRVHILATPKPVLVSADAGLGLLDVESGEQLATYSGKAQVVFFRDSGNVLLPDGKCVSGVRVVPLEETRANLLRVDGRGYRGQFEVWAASDGLIVVNVVGVEDYLRGVVPLEMSPGWPREALKAQAVTARTFAYRNVGRHSRENYDLCSQTHCQVYGGADVETAATDSAVEETAGLVLKYDDELIDVYYHASSGGYTESAGAVWGSERPYLQAVEDTADLLSSPYTGWEISFSRDELSELLAAAGIAVGRVETVEPVDWSSSGRTINFLVRGSSGSEVVSANRLRLAVGANRMKSTWVEVVLASDIPAVSDISMVEDLTTAVVVQGARGQAVQVVPSGSAVATSAGVTFVKVRGGGRGVGSRGEQDDHIVFRGRGYGHGVGMSQWGAKGLAETAPGSDENFFRQILMHYYTGVTIEPY
jgi:stage II sporulation protein D